MKKTLFKSALLALVSVSLMAGSAMAVPFQITDSSLLVNWNWGGGLVNYNAYSSTSYDLGEGDSFDFTFGQIFIPLAIGTGTAEFTVDFSTPDVAPGAGDTGDFKVWSVFIASGGNIDFGAPATSSYSFLGNPGGEVTIDFNDLSGVQLGSWIDITGTVTNTSSPVAPVPEPATMLLFGTGLLGLVGYNRKRFNKKH